MFGLPEIIAAAMLASLTLYALLGGADFGGGIWDLVATGPRAARQRALIEHAIAPVWEANHVWLILVVVLLFTAFPRAFSTIAITLHVPLTLMLLGVVLRGSAFVFRQYGGGGDVAAHRWGRVFAIASTATPIFLGVTIGQLTSKDLVVRDAMPMSELYLDWIEPFPILVGLFAVALFAFLAAVFLTNEPGDDDVRDDFRRRALAAAAAVGLFALASGLALPRSAADFSARMVGSWWSWPLQIATGLAAVGSIAALVLRRFRLARVLAASQVSLILLGWGAAQYPVLVRPGLTVRSAAAPDATLELLAAALIAGSLVLFPSLYWLLRVFKQSTQASHE